MTINWMALLTVAVVSVIATVLFMTLLAFGIRFVSAAKISTNQGRPSSVNLTAGYALLGGAGLLVLFCLYLIIPQFH